MPSCTRSSLRFVTVSRRTVSSLAAARPERSTTSGLAKTNCVQPRGGWGMPSYWQVSWRVAGFPPKTRHIAAVGVRTPSNVRRLKSLRSYLLSSGKDWPMTPSKRHDSVRKALTDQLSVVAERCAPGKYWDAAEDERLQVGAWQVRQSLVCPAREAATPSTPFESSVNTVWRASALDSLCELDFSVGPPRAFVEAFRNGDSNRWPWEWIRYGASKPERAMIGQRAISFVSGAARAIGVWPLPPGTRIGWRPAWEYPGRALRIAGRIDLLYRVDGELTLGLILNGAWSEYIRRELGFAAVMAALVGEEPVRVVALLPDCGAHRTVQIDVDPALIEEGVQAVCTAATVVAVQAGFSKEPQLRHPGSQCRYCSISDTCEEGSRWLSGPGARRFGFPVAPTPSTNESTGAG